MFSIFCLLSSAVRSWYAFETDMHLGGKTLTFVWSFCFIRYFNFADFHLQMLFSCMPESCRNFWRNFLFIPGPCSTPIDGVMVCSKNLHLTSSNRGTMLKLCLYFEFEWFFLKTIFAIWILANKFITHEKKYDTRCMQFRVYPFRTHDSVHRQHRKNV